MAQSVVGIEYFRRLNNRASLIQHIYMNSFSTVMFDNSHDLP